MSSLTEKTVSEATQWKVIGESRGGRVQQGLADFPKLMCEVRGEQIPGRMKEGWIVDLRCHKVEWECGGKGSTSPADQIILGNQTTLPP